MQFIILLTYVTSLLLLSGVVYYSIRRSEYGVLVFFTEFMFVVLGACLYPILFISGIIAPGISGKNFLYFNDEPGLSSALHVLLYSLFAWIGYKIALASKFRPHYKIFRRLRDTFRNPRLLFFILVGFGILVYFVFIALVGLDVALANAAAARSGYLEGFGEDAKYLFLKTLGRLSLLAACFLPWMLLRKKNKLDILFIVLYVLYVAFSYLNSISRSLILDSLIVPIFVYFRSRLSALNFFKMLPIAVMAGVVLLYGKSFGHYLSVFIAGGDMILNSSDNRDGFFAFFFQNLEYIWFSIEAGIINFFDEGSIVPVDVIYSFFGFLPSRFFEYLGLQGIYYGNADVRLSCVNAEIFGYNDCTMPPLWLGYSAYLFPFVGAAIFGFLKFYVLGRIEAMWIMAREVDYSLVWIPYFWFAIASAVFTLIPQIISLAMFALTLVGFSILLRSLAKGVRIKD